MVKHHLFDVAAVLGNLVGAVSLSFLWYVVDGEGEAAIQAGDIRYESGVIDVATVGIRKWVIIPEDWPAEKGNGNLVLIFKEIGDAPAELFLRDAIALRISVEAYSDNDFGPGKTDRMVYSHYYKNNKPLGPEAGIPSGYYLLNLAAIRITPRVETNIEIEILSPDPYLQRRKPALLLEGENDNDLRESGYISREIGGWVFALGLVALAVSGTRNVLAFFRR